MSFVSVKCHVQVNGDVSQGSYSSKGIGRKLVIAQVRGRIFIAASLDRQGTMQVRRAHQATWHTRLEVP